MLRVGETHRGNTSLYLWNYNMATKIGKQIFGKEAGDF